MTWIKSSIGLVRLVGLLLVVQACGTDNPAVSSQDLVGTWRLVSVNGNAVDELTDLPVEAVEVTFRGNGTFEDVVTLGDQRDVEVGTWQLAGDRLRTSGASGIFQEVTVWVEGDRLFIETLGGQKFEYRRVS